MDWAKRLVSGLVSPDEYRVDKRTRVILDRQIADKQIGIFPEKDGGTRQITLSDAQRKQTVLTDAKILALADMGSRIEAHYDVPQDIEWAMAQGEFYLLQARPITSLFPIDGLKSPDDSLHLYFSMGHQQNMTDAMAPLSISTMQNIIPFGRKEKGGSTVLVENAGHMFIDLTPMLRHPILHRGLLTGISQLDALAPQALQIAMQRPEFQRPHNLSISFSTVKIAIGFISQVMNALWRRDYTGFLPQVNKGISEYIEEARSKINQTPVGREQTQIMVDFIRNTYRLLLSWIAPLIAGEAAKRILPRLGRKWLTSEEMEALSLGLSGNAVTEMNLALGDLADIARRSPELRDWFDHLGTDSQMWLAKAVKLENSAAFMEAFDKFLAEYGARGPSEIDLMVPKWYEEPISLLKVIASYLQKEAGSHRTQEKNLIEAREKATEKLLTDAKHGLFGGMKTRIIKRFVYVMTNGSVLREHHKFAAIQVLRVAKDMLKETAIKLVEENKLAHPDDIWFLNWYELLKIWDTEPGAFAKLASERMQHFHASKK